MSEYREGRDMRYRPREPYREPYQEDRDNRFDERDNRFGERSAEPYHRPRSRSRSPNSGRRQEREWDRGKRRYSPPRSRFDDSRDHERFERRPQPPPHSDDPPSRTIMMRGLPAGAFEAEVRHALDPQIAAFVDVRVPRTMEGGNRGFGFVEFANMETASAWMEQVQGAILISNQRVIVHYCEDRDITQKRDDRGPSSRAPKPPVSVQSDWECLRCGCNNFRHRMSCFRCEAPRSEAEHVTVPSADEQVGLTPCNTLLLRNLDPSTDDNKVLQSLSTVLPVSGIKTIKIMRDPRTQQSMAYGFVQFRAVQDSTEMYNCLMRINPPLTIDGKQVAVSFAKQPLNDIIAPVPNQAAYPPRLGHIHGTDTNSAAAVAQMALQQLQKTQLSATIVQQHMHGQQNPAGVPAGYQFDAASGYYFDPVSQLYYDPNTQYFWNPQTQQFLKWNVQTQTYTPVAPAVQQSAALAEADTKPVVFSEEKPKPKTEKELEAERTVREMEKWAKIQNQKTHHQKRPPPPVEVKIGEVASVFKDTDEDEAVTHVAEIKAQKKAVPVSIPSGNVISHGHRGTSIESEGKEDVSSNRSSPNPDSPSNLEGAEALLRLQVAEEKLVDWERAVCYLCKRQLQSKEMLEKHVETSGLHLQNLNEHRKNTMTPEEIEEMEAHERNQKYRDRAKERRSKYGESEPAPPLRGATAAAAASSRKRTAPSDSESVDEDSGKPGLGSDNVGAKMMKAMGWSEGKGLGKSKQGMVDPVEAKSNSGTSGLGLVEGAPDILPTDTYASKVRKTMRNRFLQMQE